MTAILESISNGTANPWRVDPTLAEAWRQEVLRLAAMPNVRDLNQPQITRLVWEALANYFRALGLNPLYVPAYKNTFWAAYGLPVTALFSDTPTGPVFQRAASRLPIFFPGTRRFMVVMQLTATARSGSACAGPQIECPASGGTAALSPREWTATYWDDRTTPAMVFHPLVESVWLARDVANALAATFMSDESNPGRARVIPVLASVDANDPAARLNGFSDPPTDVPEPVGFFRAMPTWTLPVILPPIVNPPQIVILPPIVNPPQIVIRPGAICRPTIRPQTQADVDAWNRTKPAICPPLTCDVPPTFTSQADADTWNNERLDCPPAVYRAQGSGGSGSGGGSGSDSKTSGAGTFVALMAVFALAAFGYRRTQH